MGSLQQKEAVHPDLPDVRNQQALTTKSSFTLLIWVISANVSAARLRPYITGLFVGLACWVQARTVLKLKGKSRSFTKQVTNLIGCPLQLTGAILGHSTLPIIDTLHVVQECSLNVTNAS